ncbi:zinc-dependent alcohol dehydrogenase family protein [Aspergillus saccharolyticus JOP 1030-1]|uniref:Putative alcohol dehydrogenase n=1 Tax=Aspergillus saccharolyticus JOP 1030-1 TaxID=1450539 RepID=A0A318ZKP7_9EURO|nr:putative alcohol dehydrogenase [Aspergillus saccharolyticus JOP 1030-1]PYH48171.1 putative alcohol dehydrogenase [Aspergillus saccharolyticus JOP 1030-1]
MSTNAPAMAQQWSVMGQNGIESLVYSQVPWPTLGDNEVLVQIRGASLNPRDLMITRGQYPWTVKLGVVPGSDGAGVVVSVGQSVTRFRPGDKVVTMLNQKHIAGSLNAEIAQVGTGASVNGTFCSAGVFDEHALVAMPDGLTFVQAATLSCAGLTAWNALFGLRGKQLTAGQWILVQGTGSVSLFALQFARSIGAKIIATTSSPDKVGFLRQLGADHVINYRESPKWGAVAKELTGGCGVDLVVDTAGPATLRESAASVKLDGTIAVIGIAGGNSEGQEMPSLLEAWLNLYTARGVWVGSRVQMEEMCRWINANPNFRPVLDRKVFKLSQLKDAYEYVALGKNLGKVCIENDWD